MTQPVQTAATPSSPTPAPTVAATTPVHTPKHTPTKKEKLQIEVKEAIDLAKRGITNTEKKLEAVSQERRKFVEMFPGSMRSAVDKGTRDALGKCTDTITAFANLTEAFPTFQRVKDLVTELRTPIAPETVGDAVARCLKNPKNKPDLSENQKAQLTKLLQAVEQYSKGRADALEVACKLRSESSQAIIAYAKASSHYGPGLLGIEGTVRSLIIKHVQELEKEKKVDFSDAVAAMRGDPKNHLSAEQRKEYKEISDPDKKEKFLRDACIEKIAEESSRSISRKLGATSKIVAKLGVSNEFFEQLLTPAELGKIVDKIPGTKLSCLSVEDFAAKLGLVAREFQKSFAGTQTIPEPGDALVKKEHEKARADADAVIETKLSLALTSYLNGATDYTAGFDEKAREQIRKSISTQFDGKLKRPTTAHLEERLAEKIKEAHQSVGGIYSETVMKGPRENAALAAIRAISPVTFESAIWIDARNSDVYSTPLAFERVLADVGNDPVKAADAVKLIAYRILTDESPGHGVTSDLLGRLTTLNQLLGGDPAFTTEAELIKKLLVKILGDSSYDSIKDEILGTIQKIFPELIRSFDRQIEQEANGAIRKYLSGATTLSEDYAKPPFSELTSTIAATLADVPLHISEPALHNILNASILSAPKEQVGIYSKEIQKGDRHIAALAAIRAVPPELLLPGSDLERAVNADPTQVSVAFAWLLDDMSRNPMMAPDLLKVVAYRILNEQSPDDGVTETLLKTLHPLNEALDLFQKTEAAPHQALIRALLVKIYTDPQYQTRTEKILETIARIAPDKAGEIQKSKSDLQSATDAALKSYFNGDQTLNTPEKVKESIHSEVALSEKAKLTRRISLTEFNREFNECLLGAAEKGLGIYDKKVIHGDSLETAALSALRLVSAAAAANPEIQQALTSPASEFPPALRSLINYSHGKSSEEISNTLRAIAFRILTQAEPNDGITDHSLDALEIMHAKLQVHLKTNSASAGIQGELQLIGNLLTRIYEDKIYSPYRDRAHALIQKLGITNPSENLEKRARTSLQDYFNGSAKITANVDAKAFDELQATLTETYFGKTRTISTSVFEKLFREVQAEAAEKAIGIYDTKILGGPREQSALSALRLVRPTILELPEIDRLRNAATTSDASNAMDDVLKGVQSGRIPASAALMLTTHRILQGSLDITHPLLQKFEALQTELAKTPTFPHERKFIVELLEKLTNDKHYSLLWKELHEKRAMMFPADFRKDLLSHISIPLGDPLRSPELVLKLQAAIATWPAAFKDDPTQLNRFINRLGSLDHERLKFTPKDEEIELRSAVDTLRTHLWDLKTKLDPAPAQPPSGGSVWATMFRFRRR